MEGEASNSERPRQKRHRKMSEAISYERSVENLSRKAKETLMIVNQKCRSRPLYTIHGTSSVVFDNTSSPYRWLRSGWLVEEHLMPSGRPYRYFYDPKGQMYNTRQEVDIFVKILKSVAYKSSLMTNI